MNSQTNTSKKHSPQTSDPSRSPILLDATQAAAYVGLGESTWWRLAKAEKIPTPVKLTGKIVRWPRRVLDHWVALNCPNQKEFEAYQSLGNGRVG